MIIVVEGGRGEEGGVDEFVDSGLRPVPAFYQDDLVSASAQPSSVLVSVRIKLGGHILWEMDSPLKSRSFSQN